MAGEIVADRRKARLLGKQFETILHNESYKSVSLLKTDLKEVDINGSRFEGVKHINLSKFFYT